MNIRLSQTVLLCGKRLFSKINENHSTKLISIFISCRKFSISKSALKMRFVQFRNLKGGPQRLGVQLSQESDVIDLSAVDTSIPNNLVQFLESGPSLLDKAKRSVKS